MYQRMISVVSLLVAAASMAADPPGAAGAPQTPGVAAAPQVPAATIPPSAANTTAGAPTAQKTPTAPKPPATLDAAATAKVAHDLGYAPRQRSGKTVYCKSEASIGTRFASMKCFTEEEMSAVALRSIQNRDSVANLQRLELYEENRH